MSDHLVLIPVFDESATIRDVVTRAKRHGGVLVIDDGSTDGTGAVAAAAGAEVLRLARRHGKGTALQRGFQEALCRGVERIVTLDGDAQHDPDDIPRLLAAAEAAPDALMIGRRPAAMDSPAGDPATRDRASSCIPIGRVNAMRVASFFIGWLTRTPLVDTQSGFRVYPAALVRDLGAMRGGFVMESEVLVRAAARGWPLREVAITAAAVSARRSRFRPVVDGVAVGFYLAREILRALGREGWGLARGLVDPFRGERRRARHRALAEVTAPFRGNPAEFATVVGVFALGRVLESSESWWRAPETRCLRMVLVAVAATPVLLVLTLVQWAFGRVGQDLLTRFIRRVYDQERLGAALRDGTSVSS
jgi:hypothetical protein